MKRWRIASAVVGAAAMFSGCGIHETIGAAPSMQSSVPVVAESSPAPSPSDLAAQACESVVQDNLHLSPDALTYTHVDTLDNGKKGFFVTGYVNDIEFDCLHVIIDGDGEWIHQDKVFVTIGGVDY